ncbi:MAG: M23 family metallopeptidase [Dermatophilaceae bacterium]
MSTVPNAAYRGRHRPIRSPRLRLGALGAGLVLPTAAAVAALMTSGSASGSMALAGLSQDPRAVITALADGDESIPEDTVDRVSPERAARDSVRQQAVAAETARRAGSEDALTASESVLDVSTVPASGGGPEGAVGSATPQTAAAAASAGAAAAGDRKAWTKPLNVSYTLTSGFAMRWGSMHPAQDFAVPVGTPVYALSSGTVVFAGWQGGYGNKLEIQFWDGTVGWFAHNSVLKVSAGQTVSPGQVISLSGNTGHSTGPHVHVEIHPAGGDPVPPLPWLAAHGIGM